MIVDPRRPGAQRTKHDAKKDGRPDPGQGCSNPWLKPDQRNKPSRRIPRLFRLTQRWRNLAANCTPSPNHPKPDLGIGCPYDP